MVRKVIIEAVLVPESSSKNSKEIEKEILNEIRSGSLVIPWCDSIKRVVVIEEN